MHFGAEWCRAAGVLYERWKRRESHRSLKEEAMQRFDSTYIYGEPYTTFHTSDEEARRWVREARLEELRLRSGYFTAPVPVAHGEVAGSWADDDESLLGSEEPVEALGWLAEDDPEESWLEDRRTLAQDRAMLAWLLRDEREVAREKRERRRTAADRWLERNGEAVVKPPVTGDYWGAGPDAEKRWLDAQIAQLRIEYHEVLMARCRQLTENLRSVPVSMRSAYVARASRIAQLAAIRRQAESLRHRHNFKRYVEALYCDAELAGKDFAAQYAKVNSKRKAARLSYSAAVQALAGTVAERNDAALMGEREWTAVEGLIAA